jgi:hypothetical protein
MSLERFEVAVLDSFVQMLDVIPLLADPARFGGDPADDFEPVLGVHIGGTNPWLKSVPDDLSPAERTALLRGCVTRATGASASHPACGGGDAMSQQAHPASLH